ncbi:MFS transporter [Nostoc sp. FACHB-152]|uniref:MFS transporter n=1 Tax=unclassified Nostoc TaxID=2593658 RepID=UPI00168781D7|nr:MULTISPECIES: MFS transporter [unclassified Nostoc]MBD2448929.1 MFS transporter [Nostoc sp. FACHB-152]MBD2471183.1 MFS transporter [Nostoc sp. FACHB-145]
MNLRMRSLPLICLICAEFLSQVGNQIAAVAIPILVLQFTHSAIATGIAGAGNIIPIVLAVFVGGKVIDRFGAWRVSVVADLFSCFSVLSLPLLFLWFDTVPQLVIFLSVFVGALFDPTATSARQTLVPKFARLARIPLEKVNGYRGSLENGADLLGPVVGAGLISWIGAVNTFFVDAVSFLICAVMFAIAIPRQRHPIFEHESSDPIAGIRFIFQHRLLRSLAISGMVLNFVLLPFLGILLPILTTQKFGSTTLLGICLSLFGMAATGGALLYSTLIKILSRSAIYYSGLLLTAASIMLCAIAQTQVALMLLSGSAGLLLGAGNPLEQTLLQETTPSKTAGQVFTSHTAIHFSAGLFGLLIAGVFTELTDINLVLIISGSLLLITAAIGWCLMPLSDKRVIRNRL